MNEDGEKRSFPRCHFEAPVTFNYFNSVSLRTAKTINHSHGGIYLESDFFLKPGAAVFVKIAATLENLSETQLCGCHELRTVSLGEVKWCRNLSDSDSLRYGAGLKYYELPY